MGTAPQVLIWVLDGSKWSASRLGHFTPVESAPPPPSIHWMSQTPHLIEIYFMALVYLHCEAEKLHTLL
jgi:hypothetical protein